MTASHTHAVVVSHRFAKSGDVAEVVLLPMPVADDLVKREVYFVLDRIAVLVDVYVEVC